MFLPIGDAPKSPRTPWITYLLIALNAGVLLALLPQGFAVPASDDPRLLQLAAARGLEPAGLASLISVYDLVVFEHGFRPGDPSLVAALTAMFLHGGLAHLLGNLLFLWIYGPNVERRLGGAAFLVVYLATGAVATGGDMALRWGEAIPAVGASGAISGILGLYFVWFPRNTVRVWVLLFPIYSEVLHVPARLVIGFFVVVDNVLPLLLGGSGAVAYGAHLGGFVAGAALAYLLARRAEPEREPAARPPPPRG